MQGNIDFTGSLSGSIAGGGGGGGSTVTITPTLESGTKIADYSIDSTSGSLYAPTPTSLTAELPLSISDSVISIDLSGYQEKLTSGNYINIDSNNVISCTPPITNVWYTPEAGVQQDVLIGKFTVNEVTQNVYAPSGGSSWDYSTSEVNTGQKWINGKDLYCKVIDTNSAVGLIETITDADFIMIDNAYLYNSNTNTYIKMAYYWGNTERAYVYNVGNSIYLNSVNLTIQNYPKILVIVRYTKSA